jgi:hypothetical protein
MNEEVNLFRVDLGEEIDDLKQLGQQPTSSGESKSAS